MEAKCPTCGNSETFHEESIRTVEVNNQGEQIGKSYDEPTVGIKCPECGFTSNGWDAFQEEPPKEELSLAEPIACGYEWHCPHCNALNKSYEMAEDFFCSYCGVKAKMEPPEHAIG